MPERIKKTKDGNKYYLTSHGMWVRDFTTEQVPFKNLNESIQQKDYFIYLQNEVFNNMEKYTWIDTEEFPMKDVLIVSDGYKFNEKQKILSQIPKTTTIIGVNGSLAKWNLTDRNMNWYLVNNPYDECMRYLPRRGRSFPKCITSVKTNYKFLNAYKGTKYKYFAVNEDRYSGQKRKEVKMQIDDYRNPICAAISLAYHFGAEKIMLFCCDDSFVDERPASIKIENGLYEYEPQQIVHEIIDGMFYWISNHPIYKTMITDHSSSKEYKYASYISEERILQFFQQGGENYE
jgi:hypothetical protein